jgi:hypothetical protein
MDFARTRAEHPDTSPRRPGCHSFPESPQPRIVRMRVDDRLRRIQIRFVGGDASRSTHRRRHRRVARKPVPH